MERLALTEAEDSRALDANRAGAAAALGSLGDIIAVPALIRALSHPNQVCVAAALALGRIAAPESVVPLVAVLEDENKFWMPRGAAAVALGQMGVLAHDALPMLNRLLQLDYSTADTSWDARAHEAVVDAILHIATPGAECTLAGKGGRYAMWGIQ